MDPDPAPPTEKWSISFGDTKIGEAEVPAAPRQLSVADAQALARAIGHPNNSMVREEIEQAIQGKSPFGTLEQVLARQVGRDEAMAAIAKVQSEPAPEPEKPRPEASRSPWTMADNEQTGIFGQNTSVKSGETFSMFSGGPAKPKDVDTRDLSAVSDKDLADMAWGKGDKKAEAEITRRNQAWLDAPLQDTKIVMHRESGDGPVSAALWEKRKDFWRERVRTGMNMSEMDARKALVVKSNQAGLKHTERDVLGMKEGTKEPQNFSYVDAPAREGATGWSVGDKITVNSKNKFGGFRPGTYTVVEVTKTSETEHTGDLDENGLDIKKRYPIEELKLQTKSGQTGTVYTSTLTLYGIYPPKGGQREAAKFEAMSLEEKKEAYPYYRAGESLEEYKTRMGEKDTPDMFGGSSSPETRGNRFVDMLDRVERNARERMRARAKTMGVRLYSGLDPTLLAEAIDHAIVVAAKAIKAGIRGGQRLTAMVILTVGDKQTDKGKVERLARALIRDAYPKGKMFDAERFERAVARLNAQADKAIRRESERPKATIERTTAVAPDRAGRQERAPLEASLAGAERVSQAAYKAGERAGKQTAEEAAAAGKAAADAKERAEGNKLRESLTYAERVARRAYRAGTREAIEGLKPFVADIERQIREHAQRKLDMLKIEGRGKVDSAEARLQARQEAADWYRDKIVERLRELPLHIRGKYIDAVKNAQTAFAVVRATKRMTRDLAKYTARQDMRKITQALRKKNLAKLTEARRQEVQKLGVKAGGVWSSIQSLRRAKPSTADMVAMAEELTDLRNQIAQVYAEHRAEFKALTAMRGLSAADAARMAAANIVAAKKKLKSKTGREESPDVPFRTKMRRGSLDFRGVLQAVEGKYDGKGILERVIWRRLARAEEAYFARKRDLHARVEAAVKAAGFKGITEAFEQLSRTGGVDERLVTLRLGGKARKVGLGEAINLLANLTDPETFRLLADGAPIQFAQGKFKDPIIPEPGELAYLFQRADLSKYLPMIQAFKDIIESTREDVFKAHYTIKGFEPVMVKDRWHRQRNLEATDMQKEIPDAAGAFANRMLENMGFLKARGNNRTAPVVVDNVLTVVMDQVDNAAKIAHLAVPVRDAANVLLAPDVRQAIAERWGPSLYREIRDVLWASSRANESVTTKGGRIAAEINSNLAVTKLAVNPRTWSRQVAGSIRLIAFLGRYWLNGVAAASKSSMAEMVGSSGYLWDRYVGNAAGRMSPTLIAGAPVGADHPTLIRAAGLTLRNLKAGRVGDAYVSWKRAGRRAMELLNFFDAINARIAWEGYSAMARAEHPEWSPARRRRWVAEKTADLIRETQNGSSPLDLSLDATLNRDSGAAVFFLFTSEPYKTYNRMIRAYHQGPQQSVKVAVAEAAQIVAAAVMVQAIGWSMASAISAALGGDDEDQDRINQTFLSPQRALIQAAHEVLGAAGLPMLGGAVRNLVSGPGQDGFTPPGLAAANEWWEAVGKLAEAAVTEDSERASERLLKALEKFISGLSTITGANPAQALWDQVWGEAKHHLD